MKDPMLGFAPEEVEYLIEATDMERLELWQAYNRTVEWKQVGAGKMPTIGYGNNLAGQERPVTLCFTFAWLNGHLIAFYYISSQLADYEAAEEWAKKTYKNSKSHTGAMNFHNCLRDLGIEHKVTECNSCKRLY